MAPLRPIVSLEPFELVTVGYVGLFQAAAGGMRYRLFTIEHLTSWMEAMATREATGTATISVLENKYVPRYGFPIL